MYALARTLRTRQLIMGQVPAIGSSLLIAEFFYKFHSFTLECLAFLVTWFVIDLCLSSLFGLFERKSVVDAR